MKTVKERLDNKYSTYFPAISVGCYTSLITKNSKHYLNGKSYRFYNKDEDPLFYYPYMLTSAAHSFKKPNFREDVNFPRDKGLFFGDSGGFQLLTGKAPKGFSREVSFKWMEKNCDIFPLLDMPFPKNYDAVSKSYFRESLDYTKESAKYFLDNRTNDDSIILNVIQGRDLNEIDGWCKEMTQFKFDGWAFGGYNLTQIMGAFFYLFENNLIKDCSLFHIFMLSKPQYMIYLIYLQYLLHRNDYKTVISYDSSTPMILTAFGGYMLYSTLKGFKSIKFSNKYDFSHLKEENKVPCNCPCCRNVPLDEFVEFTTERFYAMASAHNVIKIVEYKKMVEKIIYMDSEDMYREAFSSYDMKILNIIKEAFDKRYEKGNHKRVYHNLKPFVANELNAHTEDAAEKMNEFF